MCVRSNKVCRMGRSQMNAAVIRGNQPSSEAAQGSKNFLPVLEDFRAQATRLAPSPPPPQRCSHGSPAPMPRKMRGTTDIHLQEERTGPHGRIVENGRASAARCARCALRRCAHHLPEGERMSRLGPRRWCRGCAMGAPGSPPACGLPTPFMPCQVVCAAGRLHSARDGSWMGMRLLHREEGAGYKKNGRR